MRALAGFSGQLRCPGGSRFQPSLRRPCFPLERIQVAQMPTPVKSVLPVVLLGCGGVGRYLLRHIVSCRPLHANQVLLFPSRSPRVRLIDSAITDY